MFASFVESRIVELPMSNMAAVESGAHQHGKPMFATDLPIVSLAGDGRQFLREHVAGGRPAVIEDFASSWPALREWDPVKLSARFGDKRVRVYDASFGAPGKNYMNSVDSMLFSEFLERVLSDGRDLRMFLYNISRQIPALLDDIEFPEIPGAPLRFSRRFVFTFFGCKGSTTPLHYDIDMGCVFHTVIRGTRRVRLFAPEQSAALYQHPFTVRSYVDLDEPDWQTNPALRRACGHEVVLHPGQTLFMPPGYWHEFHYLEPGIGVSLRAPSPRYMDRVRGLSNLLVLSPLDRVANRIAGRRWFDWKQRRACARARNYIRVQGPA